MRIINLLTVKAVMILCLIHSSPVNAEVDVRSIALTLDAPSYEFGISSRTDPFRDRFEIDFEDSTKGGSSMKFLKTFGAISSTPSIRMLLESGDKTVRFDWKIENARPASQMGFQFIVRGDEFTEIVSPDIPNPISVWCRQSVYIPEGASEVVWSGFIDVDSDESPKLDNVVVLDGNIGQSRNCVLPNNSNDRASSMAAILSFILD